MSAYDKVLLARAKGRATGLTYVEAIFDDFIELHGDRRFSDDPAIVGGIACLNGEPVTVIAMEKGGDMKDKVRRNFEMCIRDSRSPIISRERQSGWTADLQSDF